MEYGKVMCSVNDFPLSQSASLTHSHKYASVPVFFKKKKKTQPLSVCCLFSPAPSSPPSVLPCSFIFLVPHRVNGAIKTSS